MTRNDRRRDANCVSDDPTENEPQEPQEPDKTQYQMPAFYISGAEGSRQGKRLYTDELFGRERRLCALRFRRGQSLVKIGYDVINVLYADRETDHFRPYTSAFLLLRRHLPVRGRGRMAGERLGVADIDQTLE